MIFPVRFSVVVMNYYFDCVSAFTFFVFWLLRCLVGTFSFFCSHDSFSDACLGLVTVLFFVCFVSLLGSNYAKTVTFFSILSKKKSFYALLFQILLSLYIINLIN